MSNLCLANASESVLKTLKPALALASLNAISPSCFPVAQEYAKNSALLETDFLPLFMGKLLAENASVLARSFKGNLLIPLSPRNSFDAERLVDAAKTVQQHLDSSGVSLKRIGFIFPATWEGLIAGERLARRGYLSAITHAASLLQVAQAADRGIRYILVPTAQIEEHPSSKPQDGVRLPLSFDAYLKAHGYQTEIVATDVPIAEQVELLAPYLLVALPEELYTRCQKLPLKPPLELSVEPPPKLRTDEESFRFLINDDARAEELLARGIRASTEAYRNLESYLA
ncbi:MAG: hypothetical protein KDK48_02100 [Chlamydiia bacterium]|nr:hypothetical protein [Chlamydiia bacterium]